MKTQYMQKLMREKKKLILVQIFAMMFLNKRREELALMITFATTLTNMTLT